MKFAVRAWIEIKGENNCRDAAEAFATRFGDAVLGREADGSLLLEVLEQVEGSGSQGQVWRVRVAPVTRWGATHVNGQGL